MSSAAPTGPASRNHQRSASRDDAVTEPSRPGYRQGQRGWWIRAGATPVARRAEVQDRDWNGSARLSGVLFHLWGGVWARMRSLQRSSRSGPTASAGGPGAVWLSPGRRPRPRSVGLGTSQGPTLSRTPYPRRRGRERFPGSARRSSGGMPVRRPGAVIISLPHVFAPAGQSPVESHVHPARRFDGLPESSDAGNLFTTPSCCPQRSCRESLSPG